jgi:DNA-binding NarL/FixJ family response regulator
MCQIREQEINTARMILLNHDPTMCKKFQTCFPSPLYEILIPGTPVEALASVADPGVKIAILDTAFHSMDLSVFLGRLKAQNPRLHVLVTASIHSDSIERAARWAGVLYYATSPFNFKIFRKIIDRIAFAHPFNPINKSLSTLPAHPVDRHI